MGEGEGEAAAVCVFTENSGCEVGSATFPQGCVHPLNHPPSTASSWQRGSRTFAGALLQRGKTPPCGQAATAGRARHSSLPGRSSGGEGGDNSRQSGRHRSLGTPLVFLGGAATESALTKTLPPAAEANRTAPVVGEGSSATGWQDGPERGERAALMPAARTGRVGAGRRGGADSCSGKGRRKGLCCSGDVAATDDDVCLNHAAPDGALAAAAAAAGRNPSRGLHRHTHSSRPGAEGINAAIWPGA